MSGKYDAKFRDHQHQPYSAISAVFNDLCKAILNNNDKSSEDDILSFRNELFEKIDKSQIELLDTIIPMLSLLAFDKNTQENEEIDDKRIYFIARKVSKRDIIGTDDNNGAMRRGKMSNIEPKSSKESLHMAFRRLIQILVSRLNLVVLLLDDLQWADPSSLLLIEAIFNDRDIMNLMMIGCYRSDEVDETHIFSKTVHNLKEEQDKIGDLHISEISVGNLSLEEIDMYLQELLSVSETSKTSGLSTICHKRTLGNIYFIKVFLTSLQDASLLAYNTNIFQWRWDESKIEVETAATDNLIDLLISKMNKFSEEFLLLLKIASCLGNIFGKHTLELIWKQLATSEDEEAKKKNLDELLQIAVDEMFLEVLRDETYRFVHDKVQEAVMVLLAATKEKEALQREISVCLCRNLNEEDLERMLFVVVDLLNSQDILQTDKKPLSLKISPSEAADLHLKAAEKSMGLSAFVSAARYAARGIHHLGNPVVWEDYFDLRLKLFSIGAEAEAYSGNFEKALGYCEKVKNQERATLFDKLRVLNVIQDQPGKRAENWALTLEILGSLGYRYPKNQLILKLKASSYFRETKKHYALTPEEVTSMPFTSNQKIQAIVAFLVNAAGKSVGTGNDSSHLYFSLISCECIRLTKKYGLTEYTGSAVSSFANLLMHQNGDWAAATTTAETAMAIQARCQYNYTKTSILLKTNAFVLGWVKPLRGCWVHLMEAYRLGFLSGNLEGGAMGI